MEEKKNGPIAQGWMGLGVGKGIKWVLWDSNVALHRQEKQGDNWLTTEEIHLAPGVLKDVFWRIPSWLVNIDDNRGDGYGRKRVQPTRPEKAAV